MNTKKMEIEKLKAEGGRYCTGFGDVVIVFSPNKKYMFLNVKLRNGLEMEYNKRGNREEIGYDEHDGSYCPDLPTCSIYRIVGEG